MRNFFLVSSFIFLFNYLGASKSYSKNHYLSTEYNKMGENLSSVVLYPPLLNLTNVKGLQESKLFDLTVNGKDAFVYHTKEIRDEHEHRKQGNSVSYQGVSYVNFTMSDKVDLEIKSLQDATNWVVSPEINGIESSRANTLKLSLNKPQKFVVTYTSEGKEQSFIISAEAPETNIPRKDDKGVLWLEPGVHKYGQAWDPFVNGVHTVYIAGGAVVEATIKSKNKSNVKLLGRGLLAQSFVTHAEESVKDAQEQEWDADWLGVVLIDSKNIEIDGIAITSSPSYQLEVANCINVKINNVKLCGFGEHNNDGLHTYSTNVLVSDSFIASNDDRICITGLYDKDNGTAGVSWDGTNELTGVAVSNITIRNMVLWGLDNNGADIMLTWNGADYAKDILIEDLVSLTSTNKAFLAARHGGSADIHNLTIKNVELNHGNLFDIEIGASNYQGAGGGKLRSVSLENIDIAANFKEIGKQLVGENRTSNISGIVLKNINTKEGKLQNIEQLNITKNQFVTNISVVE